jgi:hypothetical protein
LLHEFKLTSACSSTAQVFPALKKKNPYTKKVEKIAQDYQGAGRLGCG